MRSRPVDDRVIEVTRRRLAALTAELAAARGEVAPAPAEPEAASSRVAGSAAEPRPEPEAGGPHAADPAPASAAAGRHARRRTTWLRRLSGWVGDRTPAVVVPRPHLGAAQAGLVLVIVAAGLLVAAWWLARAAGMGGAPGEVAPPRPVTGAATAPADGSPAPASPSASHPLGSPTSSSSAGAEIVVDVVGRVRDPGIAVLPAGSRVVDAVRAAGGMKPGVDRDTVNLARPLNDGEQVLVGVAGGSGAGPPVVTSPSAGVGGAPATLVNLNTADQATLETLPGVGPVTAQAILQWRAEHGGFTAVDELLEVSGIGDATLAEIAPHVTV